MKLISVALVSLFLLSGLSPIIIPHNVIGITYSSSIHFEIDVSTVVYKVVDGDTLDGFPIGRVRLADINAPERGEPGYIEAIQALVNLTLNKRVYLDVDDLGVMDKYNRIVAVVYVRYNSTHILNVNKWLVDNGYAEVLDFDNEFDPMAWSLYVYMPIEALPQSYEDLLNVYLDLNQSYYSLLGNYSSLGESYDLLSENYSQLESQYRILERRYGDLEESYDILKDNYNTLLMVLVVVVFGAGYIVIRTRFRARRRVLYRY
jgi:hypothetical protein